MIDDAIAGRMAVRVVDPFEMIDIAQDQRERGSLPLEMPPEEIERFLERLAIVDARKHIGAGFHPRAIELLRLLLHAVAGHDQVVFQAMVRFDHFGNFLHQRRLHRLKLDRHLQTADRALHFFKFGGVAVDIGRQLLGAFHQCEQGFQRDSPFLLSQLALAN